MKIYIDADGCPVVDITLQTAHRYDVQVIIICDTSHIFERKDATVITVDKGADSADFRLANLIGRNDLAVTQDYGLATMCLSKGAYVINQDGMEYTDKNIDGLLLSRYTAKKIRRGGGRLKGPKKRTPEQDKSYLKTLCRILDTKK